MSSSNSCTTERLLLKASMALTNPLIMEKIAHTLPAKDLCNLRPTCVLWNNTFTPQLKKKHRPIKLGSDISEFVDLMRSSPEILFTKFKLGKVQKCQDFDNFFATCGGGITSLRLQAKTVKLLGADGIRHAILGRSLPELTNLEILGFYCRPWGGPEPNSANGGPPILREAAKLKRLRFLTPDFGEPNYGPFISDLIQAAPILQKLRLEHQATHEDYDGVKLAILSRLRDSASDLRKLKKLKVYEATEQELQVLVEMTRSGLLLESFSALVVGDRERYQETGHNARARLLCDFLAAQAPALQKLTIREQMWGEGDILLPRLPLVHTLKLKKHFMCARYERGFTACFPALRCLHFLDDTLSRNRENVNCLSHLGVTEVKIKTSAMKLAILCTLLPSVTRADLEIGQPEEADCLRVLTTWPHLTTLVLDLVIPEELHPDVVLTGVPARKLEALKRHFQALARPLTLEALRAVVCGYKRQRSIADMHQLQDFTFRIRTVDYQAPRLSDIGVYFGLALAGPSLQRITVHALKANRVSEEAKEFLRIAVGPAVVIDLGKIPYVEYSSDFDE